MCVEGKKSVKTKEDKKQKRARRRLLLTHAEPLVQTM